MKIYSQQGFESHPLNLYKLLTINAINSLFPRFLKPKQQQLPEKIGKYIFTSYLKKNDAREAFRLGLYKDKNNNRVIAKMWPGRVKNFDYYSLKNEIFMYETLNKAIKRIGNKMPVKFRTIYIPSFIGKKETKNYLLLLTEFVDGRISNNFPTHQKIKIYFRSIEFMHFLGNQLTSKEKSNISKRTPLNYIFLYPLLLVSAFITYPRAAVYLILGIPKLIKSTPSLLGHTEYLLVHRDLHFENILVAKNRITLIDLQFCVFTEMLVDLITTLRYVWKEDEFYLEFLKQIYLRYGKRKNFKDLIQGLSIYSATHGLTGKHFPKIKIDYWIDFLKFAIKA